LASAGVGQPLNFAPPASLNFLSLAASASARPGQIQGASLTYYQLLKFFGYTLEIFMIAFPPNIATPIIENIADTNKNYMTLFVILARGKKFVERITTVAQTIRKQSGNALCFIQRAVECFYSRILPPLISEALGF
jgi:hypothetical protein